MPHDHTTLVEPSFPVYSLGLALLGAIGISLSVWSFSAGLTPTEMVLRSGGVVVSAGALFGGLYRCWTNQRRFERAKDRALAELQEALEDTETNDQNGQ
jgi:hypothetical protein